MNVELTAMLWGGISGAAVFALGLYWLWDMKPSNAETEWLRSEVKDLRRDLNEECAKEHPYQVHDLRHYTGALTEIRPAKSVFYF